MADTVLSAQMTEGELYNSIDKELSKGEKRFDSFVTNVNKTLGSINANFGDGLTKTFNSQIDNMSAKIKQLEIQLNSLTGNKNNIKITTNDSNKNTPVVNVNDIDSYYANLSKRINTTTLEEGRMRMHEISAEIDKLKNKQIDINIKVDDKYKSQLDDLNNKIKSLELEKENLKKVSITGNQDTKAITQQFDNLNSQINNYKSQINSINKLRISNADATPNVEKINSLKQEYDNIEKSIRSTQRGTETFAQVQSKLNGPTVLNGISVATERLNGQDLSLIRLNEHYKNLEVSSKRVQTAQRNSIKSEISTVSKMPTNDIDEANEKLKKFQEIRNRISNDKNPLLSPSEIQSLDTKVSNLTRKLEILHSKVNQPLALTDVMSMPTGNLNQITAKMSAISTLRGNYSPQSAELVQLNREYQNLSKTQNEALNAGVQLKEGNNKLATSFENLSKRVAFYAGLGAITGFVTQLYNIRGEYEMLERSMGALLGNFSKGTQLFNQIQAQALKSPLTVIDLAGAAKQLVAYNFAEETVADTTRRLADLSTALGVPIERLTYNLGQIKSKNVLDARDARDFANAGFAIVPMLAQMYTAQKKNGDQVVTTAQVYDMMTKKMVTYSDVMDVINKQTNDGGMFFNFQAKQAETLRGQMSNLVDSFNMMLNDMGKDNEGIMKGSVSVARDLLNNWRTVETAIYAMISAYGLFKGYQMVANTLIGEGNKRLTSSIAVDKMKIASDLERASLTRTLTADESAFLSTSKEVTSQDYAASLSTRGLRKEQLLLLATFNARNTTLLQGLVRTRLLTAEEVRAAVSAKGLGLAYQVLNLSLKSAWRSMVSMFVSNLPMIALMGVITLVTKLISAHEEYKRKLEEINSEYNDIAKNVTDISANFQVSVQSKNIDGAKEQLNELAKLAKEQYNIVINIDTSKMKTEEVVKKFNDVKVEIDAISSSSRQFANAAVESGLGDAWEKYGNDIQNVYDTIIGNKNTVIVALGAHIDKLKSLGASQKDVAAEQSVLNELMKPKQQNESQIDYLNRLVTAYQSLGIIGDSSNPFDKTTDQLRKLGLAGDETFKTLNSQWGTLGDSGKDAISSFEKQVKEIAKKINLNDIPKEQRTLQLEGAINKYATDQKLNEWSREKMLEMANKKFHTTISIGTDQQSQNKAEFDIKSWQSRLQSWADKHGITLGLSITVDTTEGQAAQEALQKAQEAQEKIAIEQRKKRFGTSTQADVDKAKQDFANAVKVAQRAGSDLSALDKKSEQERKKKEAEERKARAQREKELTKEAQAIKNEIDLIDKLSSNYDKLTKAGMSNAEAVKFLSKEYVNSIGNIDKVLGKFGIPKFDIKQFVGSDASGQLNYLEKLRNTMKSKGLDRLKPDAYKEVSVQIQKLSVDAKTYDLSKITDGLKEQLDSIKESYQLGQDIKDNPEQWNLLSNIIQVTPDDVSNMVKTAKEAALEVQDQIDLAIKQYNSKNKANVSGYSIYFSDSDRKKWMQQNDFSKDNELTKGLNSARKEAQDILTKDYSQNIKSWDELLSKYAEYEYKKNDIQKTAAKERLTLVKNFGTSDEYKQAFDLTSQIQISQDPEVIAKLQDDLTKLVDSITKKKPESVQIGIAIGKKATSSTEELNFNQFKETDLYAKAFEDLSRVGTSTLDLLYAKLQQIASSTKDPVQLKTIMKSLKDVRAQLQDRAPIDTLIQGINDWKAAEKELNVLKQTEDVKNFIKARKDLKDAERDITSDNAKSRDNSESTKRQLKAQQELNKAMNSNDVKAYIKAEDDLYQAQQDTSKGISGISAGYQKFADIANGAINIIKNVADGLGIAFSDDTERVINNIGKAISIVSAAMGILAAAEAIAAAAATTLMAVLWPLLAVTAALTIAFTLFGNKNAQIDKEIKESQTRVKNLENSYKALDRAVSSAMGDSEIGAKRAAIANKQLQLVELQRQLALEKSRSSKKQDKDKIADLEGQIIDLKNSITDTVNSIVTDLLGISSAKDAAESLVTNMIEAFRNGEDYMKQYSESFDKMIDNMIMKSIVSKVIGDKIESLMSEIQTRIDSRTTNEKAALDKATANLSLSDDDLKKGKTGWVNITAMRKNLQDDYNKALAAYNAAAKVTPDDVNLVKQSADAWKGDVKSQMEQYMAAFGITYGDTKTSDLSSLQQGIQSITETQASALEAIMNGVSGQVYSQTTILQNILNNSNVSLGTQSQILLQMRESYQIQKSIQAILTGWSNNSGQAIRVELTK